MKTKPPKPERTPRERALLNGLAAAYGMCLWNWSCIEAELFYVFIAASGLSVPMTLADTERIETLRRTFFAVIGFEIRLAMTHELAQQRWEKPHHLATWKTIHKELRKRKRVRNKIAHRTGILYDDPDSSRPPLAVIIEPIQHVYRAISYQDAKNRGISFAQLIKISKDFIILRERMVEFVLTLEQKQRGAFPQPQVDPSLALRTQQDQTPKGSS